AIGGGGAIQDQVQGEVFLFEEELEKEAVEAAVDVPVDVAQVIAGDVGPVIGKLDGLAAFLGAPLALELAGEDLLAGVIEARDLGNELTGEQIIDGARAGWIGCFEHADSFLNAKFTKGEKKGWGSMDVLAQPAR